jgi:tetratricopeptide (TPR) repeat protein
MMAAWVLCLGLLAPLAAEASDLAKWREALELDLPEEVLRSAPQLLGPQGALESSGEARYLAARIAFAAGEKKLLASALQSATLPAAEKPWIQLAQARLALEQDDFSGSLRALGWTPASELPKDMAQLPESWLVLARCFDRQGQHARAREPFERFLSQAPLATEAPSAWHALAREARLRGDAARATQCAQAAQKSAQWHSYYRARRLQLREAPQDPLPRLGLAQLFIAVDRDDLARPYLEELTTRWPKEARGWLELARLEQRAGQATQAQALYQRYLEAGGKEAL